MREDTDNIWHESPEYRQEQLSAALDGMLTPDEQTALDAHLAGCVACTRELEELRQVRMLLRALPEPALPRSFLLPVEGSEGEAVASHRRAHASAGVRMPATNVTPLRQPKRTTARTLRVTRWIGTIAAILGMALFLGTLLPMALQHQGAQYSAARYPASGAGGSAATAHTPQGGAKAPPAATPINPNQDQFNAKAATATAAAAPAYDATATASTTTTAHEFGNAPAAGPPLSDILRIVALVLLFAGAAVALVSLALARQV